MKPGALSTWLAPSPTSLRYRVYCRAFAMASAVHLLLPDALDPTWLVPNTLYWIGATILVFRGGLLGWVLSAVGLAVPLLTLGDQLTQSAYLLACAIAAVISFAGPARTLETRLAESLPRAVAVLTIGVYAIAALHKLNADFFDPTVSCANGGLSILADNWALPLPSALWSSPAWPILFLFAEVCVVVLLALRPPAGMLVAVLMHIPLTIVFAPSFAFTMVSGWVCLLREEEVAHYMATLRARFRIIVGVGAALGALSFGLYMVRHWVVYPWWSFKEALLWMLFVWIVIAERGRAEALPRRPAITIAASRHARILSVLAFVLWLANGLTPYTGFRFHHAGAMLSNLRVDPGCWNSAVFPETVRVVDPYVRIDSVEVRGGVAGPDVLEAEFSERLFNRQSLERMRRSVCAAGAGPIAISLSFDGREISTDDLCASPWIAGRPLLPNARPFQENLTRDCPEACIH